MIDHWFLRSSSRFRSDLHGVVPLDIDSCLPSMSADIPVVILEDKPTNM